MHQRVDAWLQAVPVKDGIAYRQALLFQLLLMALTALICAGMVLNVVVFGAAAFGVDLLAPILVGLGGVLAALLLLRRGALTASVGVTIAMLLAILGHQVATRGLAVMSESLVVYVLPITLAGVFVGRRGLLLVTGLCLLTVLGVLALESGGAPLGGSAPLAEPPVTSTGGVFVLIIVLFSLFLDRFGTTVRAALTEAQALAAENAALYRATELQRNELRQSQHQLSVILDGITDGITAQRPNGELLYANDAAARTVGFASAAELAATPVAEVVGRFTVLGDDGRPFPIGQLPGRLALQGRAAPEAIVRFRVNATGEERWSIVNATPVRDESGAVAFAINIFRDITELKRVQLALEAEREQLRVTLSSIGDAVIATDTHGHITFLNPEAEALTGWASASALGKHLDTVFVIVNEETRATVESPVAKVLERGHVVGLANHTVLLTRDGREVAIEDSAAPIRTAGGELMGVVLVFHDASERRREELSLRERETMFRTMADTAPVMLWLADTTGARTFFNEAWLAFTGRRMEDELGLGWTADVHPEDYDYVLGIYTGAFEERTFFQMEYRLRRADGAWRWMLAIGQPRIAPGGVFEGFVGTCIDLTERKEAEDRQRFLSRIAPMLTTSLDYETTASQIVRLIVPELADYALLYLPDEHAALVPAVAHGVPDVEPQLAELARLLRPSPSAQTLVHQLSPAASGDADPEVARLAAALGAVTFLEVPLRSRGQVHGALSLASARPDRYSPSAVGFAEEVAARCALALDNARLYRDAQRAIQLRETFFSLAAHELKTPLTALAGQAQLMQRRADRDGDLGERYARSLQTIVTQASRLNRLVLSILDISRLGLGKLSLDLETLAFDALVERVVTECRELFGTHPIVYEPAEAQLVLEGDPVRLEQVVLNLLQNAAKYSPAGATIHVSLGRGEQQALLRVRDEGIGIPPEALPRIFERFYRVPNVDAQERAGLGIGLFIVKEIVELHGGSIAVESVVAVGTTFTIALPLRQAEALPG